MSGFLFAGCSAAAAAVPVHPAALSPSSTLHPAACLALHTIEKSLSSFVIRHPQRSLTLFLRSLCDTRQASLVNQGFPSDEM
ncbi:hypothetical protein CSPX01_06946 [Colletotrichum filicis]|nr:hypothetical protein CSPX01_06946 [Colletotrichum filicis]